MAAIPLPPHRMRSPLSRTSISSQCRPCVASASRSTGSASWIPASVRSENTTPKPNVSSALFRSNTVTSTEGSARRINVANVSPPGPPPTTAIRILRLL